MMHLWWEEFPERLEFEVEALRKIGANITSVNKDPEAGTVSIEFSYGVENKERAFRAAYPPNYPYTRFELIAPDLELSRHKNPILGNLCLIGRASDNWQIDDTVASYLTEQLPKILDAARDPGGARDLEEHQGEPVTSWYQYADKSLVLFDGSWRISDIAQSGHLTLGLELLNPSTTRGCVLAVEDENGKILVNADSRLSQRYKETTRCRWMAIESEMLRNDPKDIFHMLMKENLESATVRKPEIIGLLLREEVEWQEFGDGWIFLARFPAERKGFRSGKYWTAHAARAARYGPSDFQARAPEVRILSSKKVCIFGLGCLGSALALELARCGVGELRVADADFIEPATTSRWAFGLRSAGWQKAEAIAQVIRGDYPLTRIVAYPGNFGAVPGIGGIPVNIQREFLADADLIIDATAETGIHYPLSEVARRARVPYIALAATQGGYGGRVVTINPASTAGCWVCLQHHFECGSLPQPPYDPAGEIRPIGCAEATFTGANFDLQHVVLLTVSQAVAALSGVTTEDLVNLALRNNNGDRQLPSWSSDRLVRHPACPNH
jgi:molybdopterin/thiamine biosynthesis adenylyltransferase